MEDEQLIAMYCTGNPQAHTLTEEKYGDSCWKIAFRILGDPNAADSVIREMLSQVSKLIPIRQPHNLKAYLWKTTRNIAVAQNSKSGELERVKSEISDWLLYDPSNNVIVQEKELRHTINDFLMDLPDINRKIFIKRYWYFCTVDEIAHQYDLSAGKVYSTLRNTGTELQQVLDTRAIRSLEPIRFLQSFGYIRESWIIDIESNQKAIFAPWMKWTAVGACICCVAVLGFIGLRRLIPSRDDLNPTDSTRPSISASIPASTDATSGTTTKVQAGVKETSTTETSAKETQATEKPTVSPTETSTPTPSTESAVSIRDTTVYQKVLNAKNSDQVDESVKEAFAQWIYKNKDTTDFLKTYDEQWILDRKVPTGAVSLNCCSIVDKKFRQKYIVLHYEDGEVVPMAWDEIQYADVSRDEVAELVYSAKDTIGVSDSLKDEFVDFILYSDWFAWSAIKTDHQTEWFFDMSCPFTNSDEEYITLFVKILDDDPNVTSYHLCTIYYNGTKIMDGMTGGSLIED